MSNPSYVSKSGRTNLVIGAYKEDSYSDSDKVGDIVVFVDHTTLKITEEIVYSNDEPSGSAKASLTFQNMGPRSFSAKLIFDTTGLLDGSLPSKPKPASVPVKKFQQLCVAYNGAKHRPNYLWLFWGAQDFKGVLTDFSVSYQMYAPQGFPLRAEVEITVKESVDPGTAEQLAENESPDMTHTRKVTQATSLGKMCAEIYRDPTLYVAVARANDLNQFRQLKPGTLLDFPPLT